MSINGIFSRRNAHTAAEKEFFPNPKISLESIKNTFANCDDFAFREVWPGDRPISGISICWLDGMVSGDAVSEQVIKPLTDPQRFPIAGDLSECMELIVHGGIYSHAVKERSSLDDVISDIVSGYCALIFDSAARAITFEVKTSNSRSISEPTIEKTVKGSKDAFVETLRTNTSLIRRKLRTPDLKICQYSVGRRSSTQVAVLYLDSIANSRIVSEAKLRIQSIDIDGITAAGSIEQYIVDCPRSPFPQLLHTERPDKLASELLSGRVGIIADGLPLAFITPATLSQFMRVGEDRSQHFLVASVLTLLRWLSMFLTILLPAALVAISMYHQEMIPFKLMTSMIDAKQQVPFSVAIEVLSMLVAFGLLQEAGVRLPNPVGDTVSIIGALIVGQSAVEARVVSPVAVIVVATAGICGFTQPSQDLSAALRLIRLITVLLAIALGMYGIMLGAALFIWHLCTLESCSISYTAPLSDGGLINSLKTFVQLPLWRDKRRPAQLEPKDIQNQK